MSAVDHFQGDPVRITRRAHDEIRRAEAQRIKRVCAALRAMPGLTDEAARMYARTILNHPDAPQPTIAAPQRFNPFRKGKKP